MHNLWWAPSGAAIHEGHKQRPISLVTNSTKCERRCECYLLKGTLEVSRYARACSVWPPSSSTRALYRIISLCSYASEAGTSSCRTSDKYEHDRIKYRRPDEAWGETWDTEVQHAKGIIGCASLSTSVSPCPDRWGDLCMSDQGTASCPQQCLMHYLSSMLDAIGLDYNWPHRQLQHIACQPFKIMQSSLVQLRNEAIFKWLKRP